MKKSKEFIISIIFYAISIVVLIIAFVMGLFENTFAIDKIGYFLGVAFMSLGTVFLITDQKKNKSNNDDSDSNNEK